MKIFSAQLKGTTIVVEGATASLTGSFTGSVAGIDINATNTFTASTIARLNSIETISSSNDGRVNSLESFTSSTSARLGSIETISASNLSRLGSLEAKTGSLASTGSNTFIGTQTITGSLYISSDLIVQGSSSLQNITASAVSIGTNLINLNTANPAIRYAGLSIGDSGSVGGSGSFLYDSVQDEMIFVHRGGSTVVTSSVTLMGPETYDDLGNETYLTNNRLPKGKGNEHLADSNISDSGTLVTINSVTSSFTGVVGVGTTIPSRNLHVASSGTDTTIAATKTGTDSSQIGVDSVAYIGAGGDLTIRAGGFTSATEKVRVTTGGNVGVGATNPQQILSVNNPFSSLNTLYPIAISQAGNAELAGIYSTADSITNPIGAGLAFKTYHINVGLSEKVRISNGGNVGIGTTNPGNKLHVFGGGILIENNQDIRTKNSSGTQRTLVYMNSSNKVLLVNDDGDIVLSATGNVGVSTATPAKKLDIYDANASGTDDIVRAYQNLTTNHAWYRSQRNGGANMLLGATRDNIDGNIPADVSIIWNNSNHAMAFGTNNTERLRIASNGAVAISNTLSLNSSSGASGAQGFLFFNYTGNNSGSRNWKISNDQNAWGDLAIQYSSTQTGVTTNTAIQINSNGNIGLNTTNNYGNLTIGNPVESRKTTFEGTHGIKRNILYKDFDVSGADTTWHRVSLNTAYATDNQGVFLLITVGYHPVHASMARFYQYRVFQSPYTASNSYMKVQTVFEENGLGWNYYTFSSEVQFYNYQDYLYIKLVGQNPSYNRRRSILVESIGGSYATDNIQLEVNVSAPASTSGLITKGGSEVLSG